MTSNTPFFRTGYNYDVDKASHDAGDYNDEISLTKQSFRDEVDINEIVRRFGLTGQLPGADNRVPEYGDFVDIPDYQTALNAVIEAESAFMALPALVRKRFANSPQALLDFVADPGNYDEALRLGLAVKRPEPVAPTPTAPAAASAGTLSS